MNRIANHNNSKSRSLNTALLGLAALAAAAVCFSPIARADDSAPGRAVRLSFVEGQVRITQGNITVTDQAVANAPLFEGMQIAAGGDGRAEIQFEDGSVARLSPDSSVTLTVLRGAGANGDAQLTLDSGLGYFELQGGNQSGQMSVHFADSTVTASGFTVVRVKMDKAPGELAVFTGNAHLERGNGAVAMDLHGGESVALFAGDQNRYNLNESVEPDSWDAWNSDRDQALSAQASAETGATASVGGQSQTNPAWSDLNSSGNWYNVPGEGYVWSPYDAANSGWDPYGYGNWMYTPGYGYIWASGYPWGYMPYQCGMWNYYGGFGWGWAPGMGGCQPWWFGGFYGGPRLGTLPGGYHPPRRPISPRAPSPGRPVPMLAVNRMQGGFGSLPARDKNTPVNIAGATVTALRPLPNRPGYQRPSAEFASHEATVYGGAQRSQAGAGRAAYNAGSTANSSGSRGSAPTSRSSSAPSRAASGGGGGSAPRPSGGGGGGGGMSAPRGGGGGGAPAGGGGGGGGAHK
jgi:hypothetical protein